MAQLDIQPIGGQKLDIQPLDIQPLTQPNVPAQPIEQPTTEENKPSNFALDIWNRLSEPLTDAPTRFAKSVSDYLTDPNMYSHQPYIAPLMGFLGGATEGVGNVLSSFTSPINIVATAATMGEEPLAKAGYEGIARALNLTGKATGIPVMAHGASRIADKDASWSERAMGLAEVAGGGTAFLHKPASYAGPAIVDPKLAPSPKPVTPGLTAPNVPSRLDIKYFDKFKPYRDVPVGTKYTVSPDEKLPLKIQDAMNLGFEYKGLDDKGRLIIEKTKPSPEIQWPENKATPRSLAADVVNLPRTLMASMDMSAPLRQGLGLIGKKQFWTSLPSMFKAFGSSEFYNRAMDSIADKPLFRKQIGADGHIMPSFAEAAGLKLTNMNDLTQREESIMSSLADKIPGIGSSERAYTLFLNKLRADTFEQMIKDFDVIKPGVKANLPLAKQIATFVNTASGRGNLGPLENSAKVLSSVFFSPRLMASRLGMMAKGTQALFSPEVYMLRSPSVRREYLKSLFSMAAAAGSFAGLAKLAGAELESDPASADFGKPKFGNTRLDPYGGFQQYIVLAQRLMPQLDLSAIGLDTIGGQMKSTTTGNEYDLGSPKFGESNRADILTRFLRSKTNPIINFAWGLAAGQKEISGQPMDFTNMNPYQNSIMQRFLPMLTQDIYDLINDNETSAQAKALAASMAWFGMGSQTYDSGKQ